MIMFDRLQWMSLSDVTSMNDKAEQEKLVRYLKFKSRRQRLMFKFNVSFRTHNSVICNLT